MKSNEQLLQQYREVMDEQIIQIHKHSPDAKISTINISVNVSDNVFDILTTKEKELLLAKQILEENYTSAAYIKNKLK